MEPSHDWLDHLNIPTSQLEAWKLEAPEDVPLLVWCLREGKLNFEDYVKWAKNHYSLAVIQPEFFSSSPELPTLDNSEWSPWMVPVAKWENLTYIGCVLPPEVPEEGFVYLLAHPNDLNGFYKRLDEENSNAVKEDTNFDVPTGLILNLPSLNSSDTLEKLPGEEDQEEIVEHSSQGSSVDVEPPTQLTAFADPIEDPTDAPTQIKSFEPASEPESEPAETPITELHLSEWWREVQEHFAQAVLLRVAHKEFHPVWRNGEMASFSPISQDTPSLFRIALRTKKPYHGFVIDNPIHKTFFCEEFKRSDYPPCATAILVEESSIEPYIVTFFDYNGTEGGELEQAEALAEKLSAALKISAQDEAA